MRAAEFILDDVVDLMLKNPQLTKIRVEGHTDNTGDPAYNQALSEARAETVLDYLVTKGVAADRLEARGYGFSRPIADNDTEAGRAKNRRVDFVIVSNTDDERPPASTSEPGPHEASPSTPGPSDGAVDPEVEAPSGADDAGPGLDAPADGAPQ